MNIQPAYNSLSNTIALSNALLFCVQMGRRRHEIVGAIHTQVAAGEQIKKQLQSELTRAHRLAIQEALGAPSQPVKHTRHSNPTPCLWFRVHEARLLIKTVHSQDDAAPAKQRLTL